MDFFLKNRIIISQNRKFDTFLHTLYMLLQTLKFSLRHACFGLKVLSDTLMIHHIISYQKYTLIGRIDPSKVGVIQIEKLKYIPGRNRANNTAALKNRLKHNGTSQLGVNKGVNRTGRSIVSQENYSYDFGQII